MKNNNSITNYELSQPTHQGEERFRLRHMPEAFEKEGLRDERLHTHSFYTAIWFQSGGGEHFVDFGRYPIVPGRIFFLSPGQLHCFDSLHNQTGYILEFSDDFLQDELTSESLFLKYDVFNAFDTLPYRDVPVDAVASLNRIVSAIERDDGGLQLRERTAIVHGPRCRLVGIMDIRHDAKPHQRCCHRRRHEDTRTCSQNKFPPRQHAYLTTIIVPGAPVM